MRQPLTESEKASVKASVKHAKLIEKSRQIARIIRHTDPDVETIAERTALEASLGAWLRHHGGEAFDRPWSADHERVLAKIETAINEGGLFAMALPRGHGKTTILKWCTMYVLLTGRRKYVVVIGATAELAQELVEFCRQQITESESLHAHYPQVTTYARATDGKGIKARYQLRADGKSSGIEWSKNTLVFPDVLSADGEPYASNGAILEGHGLTGAIRGKWKDTRTGKVLRPDFVLCDDPQSRESAESESQCNMRERIISGDVLGLAGPRRRIAAVMPCTVIRKGDLAHRFLDHAAHPEWQGETCRLVNKWPDAQETLWGEYSEIYREEISNGRGFAKATEFYLAHQKEMDAGADVSWDSRVRDGEVSALQTAQNLLLETGKQFMAEYQNDPPSENPEAEYILRPEHIVNRTNGQAQGHIADDVIEVVAAVDLNRAFASWLVLSVTAAPTYSVVDYGKWVPLGRKELWAQGDKDSVERAIADACEQAVSFLLARPYSGRLSAIVIDAGSDWARVVHESTKMARQLHAAVKIWPAKGASGFQYDPPARTAVIKTGFLADVRRKAYATRQDIFMMWNSCYWHMATQQGWLASAGAMGAISAFGDAKTRHQRLADECASQKLESVEYRGDKKQAKWKNHGPEHWGDCLAMAGAALSCLGIKPIGTIGKKEVVEKIEMKPVITEMTEEDVTNQEREWAEQDQKEILDAAKSGDMERMKAATEAVVKRQREREARRVVVAPGVKKALYDPAMRRSSGGGVPAWAKIG